MVQQCKSCRKLGTVLTGSLISCGFLRLFFNPGRMQVTPHVFGCRWQGGCCEPMASSSVARPAGGERPWGSRGLQR